MKTIPCIEPLETRIAPATALWVGGSSSLWSDPANWSPSVVPNNAGGTTYDVTINVAGTPTITVDGTFTVSSLINAERIEVIAGALNLSGTINITGQLIATTGALNINNATLTVSGSGAQVSNTGPETTVTAVNLTAINGGVIFFPAATSYSGGNVDTTLQASGNGSYIDLSDLQTFNGGGFSNGSRRTSVLPTSLGRIDLGGAININNGGHRNEFTLDNTGGVLGVSDIDSLTYATVTVSGGQQLNFTQLATLTGVDLAVSGASKIFFPAATSYSGGNVDTTLQASGNGSYIDLSDLQTFNGGGFSNGSRRTSVLPTSLGRIDLGGAININNGGHRNEFTLDNTGGVLGVSDIDSLTYATVTVSGGQQLNFTQLATLTGVDLAVSGASKIFFPAATSYSGGNVDTTLQASGNGSYIDLSDLQTFNGGGFSNGSRRTSVLPTSLGRIDLGGAININNGGHRNEFTLDNTGGVLGVSDIDSLTYATVTVSGGQQLNFTQLATLTGVDLAVSGASKIFFPAATSYSGGNVDTTLQASGNGSYIDLSDLQTFNGGGFSNGSRRTSVLPTSLGRIDLGGAININNGGHRNEFTLDNTGGVLGVSDIDSLTYATVTVSGGQQLNFTQLATLTGVDLAVSGASKIFFPAATSYSGGNVDTTLQASGNGSYIDLSDLQTFNGGGFSNGSRRTSVLPTSLGRIDLGGAININNGGHRNEFTLDNTGGVLDLTGTTIVSNTNFGAINGGTFVLSAGAPVALGGGIEFKSSGTPGDKFINRATLTASGVTVTIGVGVAFSNEGVLNPVANGVFDFNGDLQLEAGGVITGDTTGRVLIGGNLSGEATDSAQVFSQATVVFDGGGTGAAPKFLEAMSQDVRALPLGFSSNYAFKSLTIGAGGYVQVRDEFDNAFGSTPEVIYVETLNVPASTTLDLGGRDLFFVNLLGTGSIVNGRAFDVNAPAGTLQLAVSRLLATENGGKVEVTVTRTGASSGVVSAQLATSNGTAKGGEDFTQVFQTVTFADGDSTPQTVEIPILNDGVANPDLTFTVALANASVGATIGPRRAATVTIFDDDVDPAITLENETIEVEENGGTVTFLVSRTGARGAPASAKYRFVADTAVPGVDFTALEGTVTFDINETTKVLSFDVRDRVGAQGARKFSIRLSDPTGGATIEPTALTEVTIRDVAGADVTPAQPLTLLEGDGDQVLITVSKGTVDRSKIVVIRKDGEILIPLLDLSENLSLDGAKISVREILDATPAPAPFFLAATFSAAAFTDTTIGLPIIIGKLVVPKSNRLTNTIEIQGDVTQIVIPEESRVRRIVVDSFGEFQEQFPDLEPGVRTPNGYDEPIALIVNKGITGAIISLPGEVTEFVVKGAVTRSTINIGTKLGKFEIGSALDGTFNISAAVRLLKIDGAIEGSVVNAISRIGSVQVGGRVGSTDFFLVQGAGDLLFKGAAADSSAVTSATIGRLAIAGGLRDFSVKEPEPLLQVIAGTPADIPVGSVARLSIGGGAVNFDIHADVGQLAITGSLDDSVITFPEKIDVLTIEQLRNSTLIFTQGAGKVVVQGDVIGSTISALDATPAIGKREVGITSLTVGGQVEGSRIASETALGAVKIGRHLLGSTISAVGVAAPATARDALAIASLDVDGRVETSSILAGYNLAGLAKNPDVQIGAVTVCGEWIASSIGAGMTKGPDQKFGTLDDAAIAVTGAFADSPTIPSRIASIAIKGQVLGTIAPGSDHFGFVVEQVGAFTVGNTKLPLTTGPDNFAIGVTGDVRVRELGAALLPTSAPPSEVVISKDRKIATYFDVDGDLVTVKTSKGAFEQAQFTRFSGNGFVGQQLGELDLHDSPLTGAVSFVGANITITATRSAFGGDGWVNVGFLKAREGATGIDLGTVTIEGDLGRITVGDGDATKPAVASLKVHSIGRYDTSTQGAGGSLQSDFAGALGALTVGTDVLSATLATDATFGTVKVGFDVLNAMLSATGPLAPLASAKVLAIKSVAIGGNLVESSLLAGSVRAVTGGNPDAAVGAITIAGNFTRSLIAAGVQRGPDAILGTMDDVLPNGTAFVARIASIVVAGTGTGAQSEDGIFAGEIGSAKIDGVSVPLTKGAGNDRIRTGGTDGILIYEVPTT